MPPKILILDVETFPNTAYVWRFFKENIGAKQVLEYSTLASFAYKWLDQDVVWYEDTQHQTEKSLVKHLLAVLDDADIVVAHNGAKFDLPTIQGRALVLGLKPPSPYKIVDTLLVARYEFNFPANSLEHLAILLGVEKKGGHAKFPGFELWQECMRNNPEAWEEMRIYNKQDVSTLEEVYLKMRPFMKRHPNVAVFSEPDSIICPKCGSSHIQSRGYVTTNVGKYKKFQCQSCGGWARTRFSEYPKGIKNALLTNTA
jgi:DNA polymerase elongation subunit (family B)